MVEQTIVNAVLTQGGLAILAVVLLYLHITSIKTGSVQIDKMLAAFQAEQKFERDQCQDQFKQILAEVRTNQEMLNSLMATRK